MFEAGRVRLHGRMPELEAQLLGLPDADELMVKAQLALQIARILKDRGLTQSDTTRSS